MTQMTQIFLGCVAQGNQPRSGRNAKSAKHAAATAYHVHISLLHSSLTMLSLYGMPVR
jgi:hypothetical protein